MLKRSMQDIYKSILQNTNQKIGRKRGTGKQRTYKTNRKQIL